MIKTILYISLLGLGNHSLNSCDDSCFGSPSEIPKSGLESFLGLAIRPSKLKIPQNSYVIGLNKKLSEKKIGEFNSGYCGNNFVPKYNSRNCNTNLTNFGVVRDARYTPSKSISRFDDRVTSKKGFQKDRRIDANGRV
jgi:hypothetical protein